MVVILWFVIWFVLPPLPPTTRNTEIHNTLTNRTTGLCLINAIGIGNEIVTSDNNVDHLHLGI